jgi:hypothetical protein
MNIVKVVMAGVLIILRLDREGRKKPGLGARSSKMVKKKSG